MPKLAQTELFDLPDNTHQPAEIAAEIEIANARLELTIGTASPERRLVDDVQRKLRAVGQYTGFVTADDVAYFLDQAGVDPKNLNQRRRLSAAILNGGARKAYWRSTGERVKSRDKRRHGREITKWRCYLLPDGDSL